MMRIRRTYIAALLCTSLYAMISGCDQKSASTAAVQEKTDPAESFEEIARMVKEGIEMPGGFAPGAFVSHGESGRSQFVVNNTVTSKLLPPTSPSETYRGTITVTSKSSYSLRRTGDNGDESTANNDGYDLSDDSNGLDSVGSDSGFITGQPAGNGDSATPSEDVLRQSDEDVRTIDLAYENDRWVLKTEFDPAKERSLANAFDRALRFQP